MTKTKRAGAPKKRSAPKAEPPNAFQLAAEVADHVEIEGVVLRSASYQRARDSENEDTGVDPIQILIEHEIEHELERGGRRLRVYPAFVVRGEVEDARRSAVFEIRCEFELVYSLTAPTALDEACIQAFANVNGVFNSWPYFREFVQSASTRLGLPPLVVPVFQFHRGPSGASGKLKR